MLKYLLLFMFIFKVSYANDLDKYEHPINVTTQAILKQSGLEAKYLQVKKTSETKVSNWVTDNNLTTVMTIGSVAVPVLLYKKVELRSGDFMFKGTLDKKELIYRIGF